MTASSSGESLANSTLPGSASTTTAAASSRGGTRHSVSTAIASGRAARRNRRWRRHKGGSDKGTTTPDIFLGGPSPDSTLHRLKDRSGQYSAEVSSRRICYRADEPATGVLCVRVQRGLCWAGEPPGARNSLRSPAWQSLPVAGLANPLPCRCRLSLAPAFSIKIRYQPARCELSHT